MTTSIRETLISHDIALRPVRSDDESSLAAIFSDPTVATWWGDPVRSVTDSLHPVEGESHFMVESNGQPIGFIQCFEEADPMYRHASIDIAIRSESQGRGIGSAAIRVLATYLIKHRGHHRLTIDPAAHNTRAITAYQAVGFRPVGIMRQYERGPLGEWHDGLLMDLLADDLVE